MNIVDWAQYGGLGIAVGALAVYITRIERLHRDERKEWKETTEKQFDKMNTSDSKTIELLTVVKTLLENKK